MGLDFYEITRGVLNPLYSAIIQNHFTRTFSDEKETPHGLNALVNQGLSKRIPGIEEMKTGMSGMEPGAE
jgi:hypothetical protein